MVRHGGDVTVFAASRLRWTGKDDRAGGRSLARTQHFDGVRFVWLWTIPYYGNTWRRMANMLSYAVIVCVAQAGRPAPDVVVGSTVHPFAALAGWLIARLRGARFIYEVRDLWPQTLIDLGAIAEGSLAARGLAIDRGVPGSSRGDGDHPVAGDVGLPHETRFAGGPRPVSSEWRRP